MKILHVHRFGSEGGAGGAVMMRRLNKGLRRHGIDSKILCVREVKKSPYVIQSKPSLIATKWNAYTERITMMLGLEDVLNVNSFRIKNSQAYSDADVIHLHRVPNVFSYLAFPSLTRSKPVVWTLHEMWSFTGHCRHSLDCDRWKTGCGRCLYPHLAPAIKKDWTRLQWALKNLVFKHSNLVCVTPSKWLMKLSKQSLLRKFPIFHIPHGIDANKYRPIDKIQSRTKLRIPSDKNVILVVAQRLDTFIKGGDLLIRALRDMPEALKKESLVLVFGRDGQFISEKINIETVDLGYIADDDTKAMAYSAADIFVCTSRAESFCNVVLESMACGTPVVAFDVSALPDLVQPDVTGYLVEPENTKDFSFGITRLLEDSSLRNRMGKKCRQIVVKRFSQELMFERYLKLYHQVAGN